MPKRLPQKGDIWEENEAYRWRVYKEPVIKDGKIYFPIEIVEVLRDRSVWKPGHKLPDWYLHLEEQWATWKLVGSEFLFCAECGGMIMDVDYLCQECRTVQAS